MNVADPFCEETYSCLQRMMLHSSVTSSLLGYPSLRRYSRIVSSSRWKCLFMDVGSPWACQKFLLLWGSIKLYFHIVKEKEPDSNASFVWLLLMDLKHCAQIGIKTKPLSLGTGGFQQHCELHWTITKGPWQELLHYSVALSYFSWWKIF